MLYSDYIRETGSLNDHLSINDSNRVGSERLIRSLSSHTTVRTVRYTAVS